jgi:DNA-directed RNA polymerase beta subunit
VATSTPAETWKSLQDRVQDAVKQYFPFEGRQRRLVLNDIHFEENEARRDDIRSQEQAKEQKRTWGVPVFADVSLVDKVTGKQLDRSKVKLLTLPKPTNRYSYIVDGSEWQVDNLWRLRSGVYSHVKQNGEFETEFNLAKSMAGKPRIKIPFEPESKKFKFSWGSSYNPPLYPILKLLGVQDEEMKKSWGEEIYRANVTKDPQRVVDDFYQKLVKNTRGLSGAATPEQKAEVILGEFNKTALRSDMTKLVFGKPFERVNGEALLLGAKRILDVSRGEIKPDDRNSLVFKTLHGTDDFIHERLMKPQMVKTLNSKVANNIDRQMKVRDVLSGDLFNRPVKEFFTRSMLSRNPEQVNPLEMISNHRSTTIMAEEGGIKNEQSVTPDMKLINPSHFGFLDPIHTPESERTGITLHLPIGVKKQGNDPVMTVYDLKEKKIVRVTPTELHAHNVLLPDQVVLKENRIVPIGDSVKMKDPVSHEIISKALQRGTLPGAAGVAALR